MVEFLVPELTLEQLNEDIFSLSLDSDDDDEIDEILMNARNELYQFDNQTNQTDDNKLLLSSIQEQLVLINEKLSILINKY